MRCSPPAANTGATSSGVNSQDGDKIMTDAWKPFIRDRKITSSTWYSKDWGLFAYSFKNSADIVYSEYRSTRRDAFWFPAIYLYRQWMELGIKRVLSDICRFDKTFPTIPRKHNLPFLWTEVKTWLEREHIISSDDEFVASAERIFPIFDQIDPDGAAYRYPPLDLPHPDFINFSLDDFEKAIDQIETVFFGVFHRIEEYEESLIAEIRGAPP